MSGTPIDGEITFADSGHGWRRRRQVTLLIGAVTVAALLGWPAYGRLVGRPRSGAQLSVSGAGPGSNRAIGAVATAADASTIGSSGKPTVLLFLTSEGCASCGRQASELDPVARQVGSGAKVLGVEVDPTVEADSLRRFSRNLGGLYYPLAVDRNGTLQRRFEAQALGTVVVLDSHGQIIYRAVEPDARSVLMALHRAGMN